MARIRARGAFLCLGAVLTLLLPAHSIAQPQPPATQRSVQAICEKCGRPYALSVSWPASGGGAGMLRMGLCPACLAGDPCEHAVEEAQALRDRFRATYNALAALRREGPTALNFALHEQAYLDELSRLQDRWRSLQERCNIRGSIGDAGPVERERTREDRRRDARQDIADFDRMARDFDRAADEWKHIFIPAGEAVYTLLGEYFPEFATSTLDWLDTYTLGLRDGNDRMVEGYHDLADQYRQAGAQAGEELASPVTSGNSGPPANRDYRYAADVEAVKLSLPDPETEPQKALHKAIRQTEEARAQQEVLRKNIDRYVRATAAKSDRAASRAGNAAVGAAAVLQLRRDAALQTHLAQLESSKRLDAQLAALQGRGTTFKEVWEKARVRIRDEGLGKRMTETLRQSGADDKRIERIRKALAETTPEQAEAALAKQKARLLATEAIRQELIKQGSKAAAVEPVNIRVLEAQQSLLLELYHARMQSILHPPPPKVEPKK